MSKSAGRRARRLNAFVENVDKRELHRRHDGICGICRTPVALEHTTIDHVVPLSRGGLHSYANCVPSHEECNVAKGNRLPSEHGVISAPKRKQSYFNRSQLAKL